MNVPLPPSTDLHGADKRTERAIIEMIHMIVRNKPVKRGVEHWENGWIQNLYHYRETGNLNDLRPAYIRQGLPLRWNGRFVLSDDPDYEWRWYRLFLEHVADDWLTDAGAIVEFGCGSAHNVAWLAQRFPDKLIIGTDWSKASVSIIEEMRKRGMTNVEGRRFDFYCPDYDFKVEGKTILTVGAMEQTGKRWRPMLDWFLTQRPRRVVHIEPQLGFYDSQNPVDQTAIEAHIARGFWTGYWDALQALVREDKIEIEEAARSPLGSLLIEGYSLVVWRPL